MSQHEDSLETRYFVQTEAFEKWITEVLTARGFREDEAGMTSKWAAQTASYEVETHGARKLLHLMDNEFARSGSCVAQVDHEVLMSLPALEVWDGRRKLGPAIATIAQQRVAEMARSQGVGFVLVRECNHFGWGPAYALDQMGDGLLVGNAC